MKSIGEKNVASGVILNHSVQTKVYKNMLPESTQLLQYSLSDVRNVVYLATIDVPSLDTKSLKFPIYIF